MALALLSSTLAATSYCFGNLFLIQRIGREMTRLIDIAMERLYRGRSKRITYASLECGRAG